MYYQISLIAAFVAGMVALFAPCCISYLLPSYLGNIFKERRRVLFMTLVYSLGIFTIMLPVVLGAKVLANLFFNLHDYTYVFGGVFMIIVSIFTLIGIKFPMPRIAMRQKGSGDVMSTYTLGIFSGITSACCAPVLVGVIALSSLSATTFAALGVGLSYVFGMVTPLYIASVFIKKKNLLETPFLRKRVWEVKLTKVYPVFVSNIVGSVIFFVTGVLMIVLAVLGKLTMPAEESITKTIYSVAESVTNATAGVPGLNVLFFGIGVYLIYRFMKIARKE